MATNEPPIDEIQWHHPEAAAEMGGIHSNNVLFYFAGSPFFDATSNNAVLATQALYNPQMYQYIQTREAFEGRLSTMSGVEFIVAEQPASMAPGTGTGVWVIRKQTRRKRPGESDEITVHSTYYIVGDNIYMAPTLADILSFRMSTITSSLRKCFPAADEATTWSPSQGHSYMSPPVATNPRDKAATSKEATPMPESQIVKGVSGSSKKNDQMSTSNARLAEHSFGIHMQHGAEYMDENPITGQPGSFHLSSTGRKPDRLRAPAPKLNPLTTSLKAPPVSSSKGPEKRDGNKEAKTPKTPKTPNSGLSKPKRKKTKTGMTPMATPS